MGIQYLNLAEIDRMARSARAADQSYAMNEMRMQDYMRDRDQQQTADTLYRAAEGDPEMAAELAAQEPGASMTTIRDFQDQAAKRRDQRVGRADQEVEIGKKLAGLAADVYDQPSYDRYRSAVQGYAKAMGKNASLPEAYDDKAFSKIREHAKRFETFLKEGKYGEQRYMKRNRQTGEESVVYTDKPPVPKDTVTWGMLSPDQAKGMGLPDGGAYQRSNKGQVQAVIKPSTGGRGGGDVAAAQQMVDAGLAPDVATGLRMVKMAKNDPIKAGQLAAKTRFDEQQKLIESGQLAPDSADVRSYDDYLTQYVQTFERLYGQALGSKMRGSGTRNDPYTPESQADFDAIPKGQIYQDPDDGRPYVK